MSLAKRLATWLMAQYLRFRRNITIGAGSRVNGWALRAVRGKVAIGKDSIVLCRIDFDDPGGTVLIGSRVYIGASNLVCHTNISIDDDVIISWGVVIVDHDSHSLSFENRRRDVLAWGKGKKSWEDVAVKPVHVCRGVWIGFGASILKGVTIGEGAVIGAGAVVTRDVAPYTLVAGNPARPIRNLAAANAGQAAGGQGTESRISGAEQGL